MTHSKDDTDDHVAPTPVESPAGRVEIDGRGNSVWRWARAALDSTSVLLKRLENRDLALEPTQKVPIQRRAEAPRRSPTDAKTAQKPGARAAKTPGLVKLARGDRGGGFDPYNSR